MTAWGTYLKRWERFNALRDHALRGREVKSLNSDEITYVKEVIRDHSERDIHEYIQFLNRMTISDDRVRVKKRTQVWGLLLEAATAEVPPRPRRT